MPATSTSSAAPKPTATEPGAATGRRDGLLLAALAIAVLLPGIGARSLWNPDEPRYAEVAREMRLTGDWLLPHLNGELYSQKPPLLFWLIDLSAQLTGKLNETAVRLPSAVAAVVACLAVLAIGRRLFGPTTGWLAALVYLASAKLLWQARVGQIDMLLGALVAVAMACWLRGWQEDRLGWRLAFFVAAGFGTLAKGPVALLPALLAILAFLLWDGDRRELRRLPVGRGLLLWAAVVAAWLGPALLAGGEVYFEQIVLRQNITRYADPWHHIHPWHYYLTNALPADFQPWLLLLPAACLAWRRELAAPVGEADLRYRSGLRLATCWVVATLVFFSLSPAKRSVYIFQMFPALALLVAAGLALAARRPAAYRRWLATPTLVLGAVLLAAVALLPGKLPRHPELAPLGNGPLWVLGGVVLLLALGFVVAGVNFLRCRIVPGVVALAAAFLVASIVAFAVLLPAFDLLKSARPLAARLLREAAPTEPYAIYPRLDPTFLFYTERFAETPYSETGLRAYLRRPTRVWLLIERGELAGFERPLTDTPGLVEVARDLDLENGYILFRKD